MEDEIKIKLELSEREFRFIQYMHMMGKLFSNSRFDLKLRGRAYQAATKMYDSFAGEEFAKVAAEIDRKIQTESYRELVRCMFSSAFDFEADAKQEYHYCRNVDCPQLIEIEVDFCSNCIVNMQS